MTSRPIVLVAFNEQDNLGIGYIASVLIREGFKAWIIDFRLGPQAILEHLRRLDPVVVGFSVIFQHYIQGFRDLIRFLRQNGIRCHFSAGGHYPSLRYEQVLNLIPELDSVVLFEGEVTFTELVRALAQGEPWQHLPGLAFQRDGVVVTTPLRPLEPDLDRFPPPVRQPLREYAFGNKFATLLAGRGCVYHCSFCSIREFYSRAAGPFKRIRRPEMVVREMELLHQQRDCSIFMFQDDDFPITYRRGAWLTDFCQLLDETGLSRDVMWKVNCRPDEVRAETFTRMKSHGLFLVYLGIESGTDEGLRRMDKRMSVATSLRAVACLKDLDIAFDYGFMLFDPSSEFDTVSRNLDFLDELVGDGSSPVTFCKMLPYAGTKVEQQLRAEGRLVGAVGAEDYHFLDPRLDVLYQLMASAFGDWIGDHTGLLNLARWVRYYFVVHRRYFPPSSEFERLELAAQALIADSNRDFTNMARRMVDLCRRDAPADQCAMTALQRETLALHASYRTALERVIDDLENLHLVPAAVDADDGLLSASALVSGAHTSRP
jgi:anaerobic magnesium-protoporphyrin IX monomethyl ester cyclase